MVTTTTKPDLPISNDLQAVIDWVTDTYHDPLEAQLSRLDQRMTHVAARYGLSYRKLQPIAQLFVKLEKHLRCHVADWKELLFPLIRQLGPNLGDNVGASDAVATVIREGQQKDERIAKLFQQMSELTDGYDPASGACSAYQDIVHSLATLDERTRTHFEAEEELLSRVSLASHSGTAARKSASVEAG